MVVQRAFGEQYVLDYQFWVIENQLWVANFTLALLPNIFYNQLDWPLRSLAEIKVPETRPFYFHSNISPLDLWPEKLLMNKRKFGELRAFWTIPSWFTHLLLQLLYKQYQLIQNYPWALKKNQQICKQETQGSLAISPPKILAPGVNYHFSGRAGGTDPSPLIPRTAMSFLPEASSSELGEPQKPLSIWLNSPGNKGECMKLLWCSL